MNVMTAEQVAQAAPAAYAKRASRKVSEKYGFIPTSDMIAALGKAGFVPVSAKSQRSYKGGDNDKFGRHVLRFRATGKTAKQQVGDVVPEIILIGSHNGRTRFILRAGMHRLVCANGMTVATHNFGEISVKHTAGILPEVVKAATMIIKDAVAAVQVVDAMRTVKLDTKSATAFAKKALALRYRAHKNETASIGPEALLAVRRKEDEGLDLWHVFNRVQENLTKGGMDGAAASGRRVVVRAFGSPTRDAQVNFDLWQLALSGLKKAGKMPKLVSALPQQELAA